MPSAETCAPVLPSGRFGTSSPEFPFGGWADPVVVPNTFGVMEEAVSTEAPFTKFRLEILSSFMAVSQCFTAFLFRGKDGLYFSARPSCLSLRRFDRPK